MTVTAALDSVIIVACSPPLWSISKIPYYILYIGTHLHSSRLRAPEPCSYTYYYFFLFYERCTRRCLLFKYIYARIRSRYRKHTFFRKPQITIYVLLGSHTFVPNPWFSIDFFSFFFFFCKIIMCAHVQKPKTRKP